jgi:pimeloyl-ACP methyl ester carboxylesterase
MSASSTPEGPGSVSGVIAPDQRGIGLTDKPQDGYDTGTLAGDLVALTPFLAPYRTRRS